MPKKPTCSSRSKPSGPGAATTSGHRRLVAPQHRHRPLHRPDPLPRGPPAGRRCPAPGAAGAGRIGFDHARVLADHADSPNRDNLLDDENEIVGWAVELASRRLPGPDGRLGPELDEPATPACPTLERQRRRRRVRRTRTKDGLHRHRPGPRRRGRRRLLRRRPRRSARRCVRADRKAKLPAPTSSEPSASSWPTPLGEVGPPVPGRRRHHQAPGPPRHPGAHRDVGPVGPAQGAGLVRTRRRHPADRGPDPPSGL